MTSETEVSIVIPTYNRAALLRNAVHSLLRQDIQSTFEIIVVDNNSKDNTRAAVHALMENHPGKVQYIVEPKQGNAHARNLGIKTAKGAIIAFIDDDVTVESNWLKSLKSVLDARGDLAFVGGRVLPQWSGEPPSWVTRSHWSPLALLDYGPSELTISGNNPRGLLTANIAFRRNVFEELGMFSPHLQRVKDVIGSMEDHEFLLRVCRRGKRGMYIPDMIARAPVEAERLTKSYHRRWHTGHGRFYAVMRDAEWEQSKSFRLMDVPGHVYRQMATAGVAWFRKIVTGQLDQAFWYEGQFRFSFGFVLQRQKDRLLWAKQAFLTIP